MLSISVCSWQGAIDISNTFQPWIFNLWQKHSQILNVYNLTAIRALIEHDDIQSMTFNLIPPLMNCIKTKMYAGQNLSIKFPFKMQRGIHLVETKNNGKESGNQT